MHFLNRAQLDAPYDAAGRPNGRLQHPGRLYTNQGEFAPGHSCSMTPADCIVADPDNHEGIGQNMHGESDGESHRNGQFGVNDQNKCDQASDTQ